MAVKAMPCFSLGSEILEIWLMLTSATTAMFKSYVRIFFINNVIPFFFAIQELQQQPQQKRQGFRPLWSMELDVSIANVISRGSVNGLQG